MARRDEQRRAYSSEDGLRGPRSARVLQNPVPQQQPEIAGIIEGEVRSLDRIESLTRSLDRIENPTPKI